MVTRLVLALCHASCKLRLRLRHLGQVWPQASCAVHCRWQPPSGAKESKAAALPMARRCSRWLAHTVSTASPMQSLASSLSITCEDRRLQGVVI
jgi:hypothetical protein